MHLIVLADSRDDALVHLATHNFAGVTKVTVATGEYSIRGITADCYTSTNLIQTRPRYEAMEESARIACVTSTWNGLAQRFVVGV